MKHDANWNQKTKRTVRPRTCFIYAFRSVVCLQHGIKQVLRVTKPLKVPDEITTPCAARP